MENEHLLGKNNFKPFLTLPQTPSLNSLLQSERNNFKVKIKTSGDWSNKFPDTPLGIDEGKIMNRYCEAIRNPQLLRAIEFLSPRDKKSWNEMEIKLTNIVNAGQNLSNKIQKNGSEKDINIISNCEILIILRTAEHLLTTKAHKSKHDFAKKHGFIDSYSLAENYGRLNSCMSAQIKIDEISIEDVFKAEEVSKKSEKTGKRYEVKTGDIRLSQYLKFIIEASLSKEREDFKKHAEVIMKDNSILSDCPVKAEQIINSCYSQIAVFSSLTPKSFNSASIPFFEKNEEDIVEVARGIVEQTYKMKERIAEVITSPNPESQDFTELRDILTHYLDEKTEREKIIVLEKLGIDSIDAQINYYRQIQKILSTPLDNKTLVFYTKLANCIEEITEKRINATVLTINDAPSFLRENIPPEIKSAPNLEDIKTSIKQFYGKHSRSVYKFNPQEIPMDFLKTPADIYVAFFKNNAHDTLSINLIYNNNKDRSSTLNFSIDLNIAGDEAFDWQFIETPNDPKMGNVKNAIFHSIPAILNKIQGEITTERYLQQSKCDSTVFQARDVTTKIPEAEYIPREKSKTKKTARTLSPIEEELKKEKTDQPETKTEIKGHIIFPNNKRLHKLMKGITPENQEEIFDAVREFNEKGTGGTLKMLDRSAMHEGKRIIELRISDKYRLLTTTLNSPNNNNPGIHTLIAYKAIKKEDVARKKNNKFYY